MAIPFMEIGFGVAIGIGAMSFFIKRLLMNLKAQKRIGNYKHLRKERRERKRKENESNT